MRVMVIVSSLALAAGAAAAAQSVPPHAATAAPGKPAPPYVVVQGETNDVATAGTQLTVICPAGHRVFGVGYSALVRVPVKTAGAPPAYGETGLDDVRSTPNMDGSGWLVSGISPDAVRLKQPWRLVVRVVCVQA